MSFLSIRLQTGATRSFALVLALPLIGGAGQQGSGTAVRAAEQARPGRAARVSKPKSTPKPTTSARDKTRVAKNAKPPVSGGKAPAPAPNKPPALRPAPEITYFSHDAKDWLKAGQTARFVLQGTPGAQATVRIEGLADRLALQEVSPGRYQGSWTVPEGSALPPQPTAVTAELSAQGRSAAPQQTARPLCVDILPPQMQNILPQQTASNATPTLSADLSDAGSGIDINSVHLFLNGRDITGEARVTSERIVYTPLRALDAGEQTARLILADRAGNRSESVWRFTAPAK